MLFSHQPPALSHLFIILITLVSRAVSQGCPAVNSPTYDFGSCPNPGITSQPGGHYAPIDQTQFPQKPSADLAAIESYICARLASSQCNASPEAVQACESAFWTYAGLTGSHATHTWNEALGLDDDGNPLPPAPPNPGGQPTDPAMLRVSCTQTTVTQTKTLQSGQVIPVTSVAHPGKPPAFGTSTAVYTMTEVLTLTIVSLSPGVLTLYPTSTETQTFTDTVFTVQGGGATGHITTTTTDAAGESTRTDPSGVATFSTSTASTATTLTSTALDTTSSTTTDLFTVTSTTTTTRTTTVAYGTGNPNAANTIGSPFADGTSAAVSVARFVSWTLLFFVVALWIGFAGLGTLVF